MLWTNENATRTIIIDIINKEQILNNWNITSETLTWDAFKALV